MANNIKISIDKVMEILTKVKTKLSEPDANSASIIGYIDGQLDALDAMKPEETDITAGSRSVLDTVPTVPADEESITGVVKLDNVQLNKMIEEMREAAKPNIVYVPQQVTPTPWWQQVTYGGGATADYKSTTKITLDDVPQAKPTIPMFHGADCRA